MVVSQVPNDSTRRKRSLPGHCPEKVSSYESAQVNNKTCYITAEINSTMVTGQGYKFPLGDGKNYGGYNNAPLTEGENYQVSVGVIILLDDVSTTLCLIRNIFQFFQPF